MLISHLSPIMTNMGDRDPTRFIHRSPLSYPPFMLVVTTALFALIFTVALCRSHSLRADPWPPPGGLRELENEAKQLSREVYPDCRGRRSYNGLRWRHQGSRFSALRRTAICT